MSKISLIVPLAEGRVVEGIKEIEEQKGINSSDSMAITLQKIGILEWKKQEQNLLLSLMGIHFWILTGIKMFINFF